MLSGHSPGLSQFHHVIPHHRFPEARSSSREPGGLHRSHHSGVRIDLHRPLAVTGRSTWELLLVGKKLKTYGVYLVMYMCFTYFWLWDIDMFILFCTETRSQLISNRTYPELVGEMATIPGDHLSRGLMWLSMMTTWVQKKGRNLCRRNWRWQSKLHVSHELNVISCDWWHFPSISPAFSPLFFWLNCRIFHRPPVLTMEDVQLMRFDVGWFPQFPTIHSRRSWSNPGGWLFNPFVKLSFNMFQPSPSFSTDSERNMLKPRLYSTQLIVDIVCKSVYIKKYQQSVAFGIHSSTEISVLSNQMRFQIR